MEGMKERYQAGINCESKQAEYLKLLFIMSFKYFQRTYNSSILEFFNSMNTNCFIEKLIILV